ncbi:MAG: glycosyltransferase family 2 protein [Candidatus Acidiferrales bacterium]
MHSLALIAFWVAVSALTYAYLGYPAMLGILGLFVRDRKPAPGDAPRISLLIAAYNEQQGIRSKIEQTLNLSYPADKFEILVLSDGSTDRTDEIVRSFDDPRVRLLRMDPRRGKTAAQNCGVQAATGEIVVFSDATTVYHPQALRYLACRYQDPKVGAVSGRYQYFDPQGDSPTGLGTIAFWNYENLIKSLQSRIYSISGCCGCIYSVRKSAYTNLREDVISDLVQPLWVIQKGYRVVFEDRALAYEETTRSSSEEFSMRVRVVTRGIRGLLGVPDVLKPWRFPWISLQLFSHKILRWLVPFFLILLFASSAAFANQAVFRLLLVAQSVFYLWAILTLALPIRRRFRILNIPLYFCLLNAAAFCSVIEILRGRKYITWETVRT